MNDLLQALFAEAAAQSPPGDLTDRYNRRTTAMGAAAGPAAVAVRGRARPVAVKTPATLEQGIDGRMVERPGELGVVPFVENQFAAGVADRPPPQIINGFAPVRGGGVPDQFRGYLESQGLMAGDPAKTAAYLDRFLKLQGVQKDQDAVALGQREQAQKEQALAANTEIERRRLLLENAKLAAATHPDRIREQTAAAMRAAGKSEAEVEAYLARTAGSAVGRRPGPGLEAELRAPILYQGGQGGVFVTPPESSAGPTPAAAPAPPPPGINPATWRERLGAPIDEQGTRAEGAVLDLAAQNLPPGEFVNKLVALKGDQWVAQNWPTVMAMVQQSTKGGEPAMRQWAGRGGFTNDIDRLNNMLTQMDLSYTGTDEINAAKVRNMMGMPSPGLPMTTRAFASAAKPVIGLASYLRDALGR